MKVPRLRTQGTRKQGCKACIHIREYILFPEYSIEKKRLSKWSKLVEKIHQLVSEGVTVVSEMRRALNHYVKNDLCQDSPPDPNDHAYHPSNNDIKNHIYQAKSKLQFSSGSQQTQGE